MCQLLFGVAKVSKKPFLGYLTGIVLLAAALRQNGWTNGPRFCFYITRTAGATLSHDTSARKSSIGGYRPGG